MQERYTHDEVKALRLLAREEILDEIEARYGVRDELVISPELVESRVRTYILAGLKP